MSTIYKSLKGEGCKWRGTPRTFVRDNMKLLWLNLNVLPHGKDFNAYCNILAPIARRLIEKKPAYQKKSSPAYIMLKEYLLTEDGITKWRQVRFEALRLSNGACCLCGARAKDGAVLHVDHIKPKSLHPELAFDVDNLQVLCADCNLGKGNRSDDDFR
jgi:hypothetical protein